jgi:predicted O-methyltransferase YrrM
VTQKNWTAVDDYITGRLIPADPAAPAMAASAAAGLPAIEVSPAQGKLLYLLARLAGARAILEIGSLGGYSTVWLARALPADGRLISLEIDPERAAVARTNLAAAGLADRAQVRTGAALDLLPEIEAEQAGPFDFVFIDADKVNSAEYIRWAKRLCRPGAAIVLDNAVREGRVLDDSGKNEPVMGIRAAFDLMAEDPDLDATAIQTVGAKGWDGFALAVVE